ncbi:MAG TPA: N-formylglutamate amidohydrolase [Gallionellaceae bacterium]|nr:N-formylglutamate amidohydrolase [Gallionellaceae bacterium]
MSKNDYVLITCEHGGNHIPYRYRKLFSGAEALLQTHRGYDAGALAMAKDLAKFLGASLFVATTSRLLVDLNRSIGHPRLYSDATRKAPVMVRREILQSHYLPYRNKVEADIFAAIERGSRVIHIASHSFTPELGGVMRNADIGLLYDPSRSEEAALCRHWQMQLKAGAPNLKVRRNYPYTGRSDGFTAYLRRSFHAKCYVGIELEINQNKILDGGRRWRALRLGVIDALGRAMTNFSA